ncbi:ankyrin repeat-containing domain protein [Melampsora americana]|nr:ankyrin repeat-containing domain protein [Melampsora americana]
MSTSTSSKRRHAHQEPPPFQDERSPSARLAKAIESSSVNLVRRLLNTAINSDGSPLDPSQPDPVTRKTSLMVAAEVGDVEMCRMLIEEYHVESDAVSRDPENNTVIHIAASRGSTEIITLYHSHYPFVLDWANSEGMTALHVAAQKGHESTISLLLDLHADVELTDNEGNTSLHYAAGWGHLKIVLLLIDRGCPFWAKNNSTFTASDYAFSSTPTSMKKSYAKPLSSPTSSFTAKTVSHLISKDLEAIQDFRTRSGSNATSLTSSSTSVGVGGAPSPNFTTHFRSESPTTTTTTTTSGGTGGVTNMSNRLLPLHLSGVNERSTSGSTGSVRSRRSSGNLIGSMTNQVSSHSGNPNPSGYVDNRTRAGSTDSDKSIGASGAGGGGGLSRLSPIVVEGSVENGNEMEEDEDVE